MTLALGTMNLVKWEFLLCEWLSFGHSVFLFQLRWRRLFLLENFWCNLHYFFNKFWKSDTGLPFGLGF